MDFLFLCCLLIGISCEYATVVGAAKHQHLQKKAATSCVDTPVCSHLPIICTIPDQTLAKSLCPAKCGYCPGLNPTPASLTVSMVAPSINDVVVMFQTQNKQLKDLTEKDAKDTARNAAEISALGQKLDALKQQDDLKTQMLADQNKEITALKQQDALKTLEIASLKQQDVVTSHMLANQSVDVLDLKTCASTQAAFMAVLSSITTVTLAGDTPVIYDKVITNTDGSYDPRTGQFKVSTPGVYLLSVSGVTLNSAVELDILINSEKITSTSFQNKQWASGFASAIVPLKVNDIVHVETEASFTGSHKLLQRTSYAYQPNVFQGTLLHSDNCVF